jgi:hypothetical protein
VRQIGGKIGSIFRWFCFPLVLLSLVLFSVGSIFRWFYCPLAIRVEFQKGSEEVEAIRNICRASGLNALSLSTLCGWFERFEARDDSLRHDIGTFYYHLIPEVTGKYGMLKHAIFHIHDDQDLRGKTMLGDRFILTICRNQPFSLLYDPFTGTKR